jgi:galactokinase
MTSEALTAAFRDSFGGSPAYTARSPGRVNLLGEHVDYNQGLALPMAIGLGAEVALEPRMDGLIELQAVDLGTRLSFSLGALKADPEQLRRRLPAWALYPIGVCWAWTRSGRRLDGFNAAYACHVPAGSGLSSSSAIETALAFALSGIFAEPLPPVEGARLCQAAEHALVGVRSGLMDPWVALEGRRQHALQLDFLELTARPIRLPNGVAVVAADTGVRRSLSASAYNQRVDECRQAVAELARLGLHIESLRQVTPAEFNLHSKRLSEPARRRAQHVVDEIERVRTGTACLEAGDAAGFGALMNASHASLRDLYEVSGAELDRMVAEAQSIDGCLGSRLTGAGFGGSTVSLVEAYRAEAFCDELSRRYTQATGQTPVIRVCAAGDGASGDWFAGQEKED